MDSRFLHHSKVMGCSYFVFVHIVKLRAINLVIYFIYPLNDIMCLWSTIASIACLDASMQCCSSIVRNFFLLNAPLLFFCTHSTISVGYTRCCLHNFITFTVLTFHQGCMWCCLECNNDWLKLLRVLNILPRWSVDIKRTNRRILFKKNKMNPVVIAVMVYNGNENCDSDANVWNDIKSEQLKIELTFSNTYLKYL